MKIAVDTTPLFTSRAGVARYVRGLLAGFRALQTPAMEIAELGWPVENFGYAQPMRAIKTLAREWGWANLVAPRLAKECAIVHHTSLPIVPFFASARHIVTLHDLALLRHPERFRPWQRTAGRRRLQRIAQADKIICVSRFTADEAMALLDLPVRQVEVVHEGAGLPAIPTNEAAAALPDLPTDYFLFVGSLEPGKNLSLLRDVYLAAEQNGVAWPALVIVGARWSGVPSEGKPPRNWHYLGHVADAQLDGLYRGARALLFPSRYEGFGLPVLEAMRNGCPVICGAVASLPEVAGDAAAYTELAPAPFGAAMHRMLRDDALAADLKAKGMKRATEFSWDKCARETQAVYEAVIRG
jgi:glycosyltransferase involved in cell wall biosynthesis